MYAKLFFHSALRSRTLDIFKKKVIADGGIVESCIDNLYEEVPAAAKYFADLIYVPGAYKANTVYAMDKFGTPIALPFNRGGTARRVNATGELENMAANIPRISYDGAGNGRGLLLERAATNLYPISQVPSISASGATFATGGTTPYYPGDTVFNQTSQTNNASYIYLQHGNFWTQGAYYTLSISVKKNTTNYVIYGFGLAGAGGGGITTFRFNFTTKTFTPVLADPARSENVTTWYEEQNNGWIRLYVSFRIRTNAEGSPNTSITRIDHTTLSTVDAYSDAYFCSPQTENGAAGTSYIPTVNTQVTRIQDSLNIPGAYVPHDAATLFVNLSTHADSVYTNGEIIYKTGTVALLKEQSGTRYYIANDPNAAFSQVADIRNYSKIVTSYGPDSIKISRDGSNVVASAYAGTMGTADEPAYFMSKDATKLHLKSFAIFPKQLSDIRMQKLST